MRNLTTLSLIFFLLVLANPGASGAEAKWVSHVDPSLMSEIVLWDGELYIASTGGLLIYNPSNSSFEQFTNTIGLPSNFLTCLTFDSSGDIYVGTEDSGVARLRFVPGGFDVIPLSSTFHGLSDDRITSLTAWGDSVVYGTKNGAGLIIKGFPGPRFVKRDGLPNEVVNDVIADEDRAWIATDSGVVYLDRFGFITEVSAGLPDVKTLSLAKTDTALWVGTAAGVAYLTHAGTTWVPGGLESESVFSLYSDGSVLWAGSRATLYENDGAGSGWLAHPIFNLYVKYSLNNRLSEIRAIQPMPDGTVYFGAGDPRLRRRGCNLLFFDGNSTVVDRPFKGIPANTLLRFAFDIDQSLWISTTNFGVVKLTPTGEWFAYNSATGDTNLSSNFNLAFLADSQGSKWFCSLSYPGDTPEPDPLDQLEDQLDTDYSNDTWTHHRIGDGGGDGLRSLRFQEAREDPAGNRWFLSDEDQENAPGWWGINILSQDGTTWRHVNPTSTDPGGNLDGMKAGNVVDVAFGEDGIVYLALRNFGVQAWIPGGYDTANLFDLTDDTWIVIKQVGVQGGFQSEAEILSLALRSDGALWVGTTVGAYRIVGTAMTHIPANRGFGVGLLGNVVNDLEFDRQENLWIATDLGLNRIARDDIGDIASFTTPIVWQTQLNLFFPPDVVSPIVNADCRRLALHPEKTLLYIATGNGLSVLDISSLERRETDLSTVYLYPNPIRTSRGDVGLKIANIDSEVRVAVYTLEGELVHRQEASTAGDVVWDLTTKSGFLAASGVYLVRISSVNGSVVKMISLIQ
ncbi:MAG: T9SS type A sorting domain-containing protein [Candidatus Latescibacterota bacterium]|nr:MAG: T9SS type A sorting domain-containing protein [Candidatus Latescibacterota bacterium]